MRKRFRGEGMLSNLISLTRFARAHRDHRDNLLLCLIFCEEKSGEMGLLGKGDVMGGRIGLTIGN